ncbi:hypothetical protein [Croceivirga sp. JEA036]|uniref:hypothetical protein n=1 Tax=Croceivirga sp. JEA036 TaxID=2721162 RepID=UPI00143B9AFD|nr:hypothetical protein [Croceivirga sp. JEA036]NJB36632.1 hypothetical protein [Croceivirga sp. JEA036]
MFLDLFSYIPLVKGLLLTFLLIYLIYNTRSNQKKNTQKKILFYNTLLFCIPLIAELSILIPKGTTSIDILYLTIDSYGFIDIHQFSFVILRKIAIISAFLIWFFTEKQWWRYAILAPILVTGNQIINVFNTTSEFMDEIELYQSGPFLLAILIVLLLLAQAADHQERIKAFLRLQYQHIEHAVEQRFGRQQQNIEEKKRRLATKKDLSKAELAALKKELEQELKKLS